MSKNEFDELLLKKFREAELEYNPASWDKLSQLLPSSPAAGDSSFDALLREKLEQEELEYKKEHWEQLTLLLPPTLVPINNANTFVAGNKNKRWGFAAGIAAAIVLMLGTVFFYKQMNNGPDEPTQPSLVKKEPKPTNTIIPQQNNTNTTTNTPQNSTVAQQSNLQPQTVAPVQQQPVKNNAQNNSLYNTINPVIPNIVTPQQPQIAQNNIVSPQPSVIKEDPPVEEKIIVSPTNENRVPENYTYNNTTYASAFYEGNGKSNKSAKTSISVAGGVNYGNLNTGYSAGVSVRHKVAGDFFVDGTVAMMYNNNASNVAINNGPSLSDNTAARPASFNETPLASPALDPIQKLYYVQFNPSIGYQLEKHVALSIGGDFQQMLNKKEEIVQPESNNSKLFPNFDVGLTTKSEFSITPNIQAGLLYREGLNNLLKNDGSKYVNRRYIQVQFKYNIPVN